MEEADADPLTPLVLLLRYPREDRMVKAVPLFTHVEAMRWIRLGKGALSPVSLLGAKFVIRCNPRWVAGKEASAAARVVDFRHEPMER
jgi:hypothetical protein